MAAPDFLYYQAILGVYFKDFALDTYKNITKHRG